MTMMTEDTPLGTPVSPLRRYAPPLILLAVTIAFTLGAFNFAPISRAVPLLVGVVTTILLVLDLLTRTQTLAGGTLRRFLNPDCAEETGVIEDDTQLSKEIASILWIAGFTVLVLLIGFTLAIPVYLASYMLIAGRFGPMRTALVTAGFSLGIWGLFEVGLRYRLYGGIFFE